MKRYWALRKVLNWLVREIAMNVILDMTHRARDRELTLLINRAMQMLADIDNAPDDDGISKDMDDIPF